MPECGACLFIGDDNGDGTATMTCQLELGHPGHHVEKFERPADQEPNRVFVSWTLDERVKCDHCDAYEHEHCGRVRYVLQSCPLYDRDHDSERCETCLREAKKAADACLG